MLDAKTHLITASSISDYAQVRKKFLHVILRSVYEQIYVNQGFEAIVDTKDDYPIRSRENILIRPGHMVSYDMY